MIADDVIMRVLYRLTVAVVAERYGILEIFVFAIYVELETDLISLFRIVMVVIFGYIDIEITSFLILYKWQIDSCMAI